MSNTQRTDFVTVSTWVCSNIFDSMAARRASHFLDGDDKLSRACSAIWRARRDGEEAYAYDSAFDAGEFSGVAIADHTQAVIDEAEGRYEAETDEDFFKAVRARISPKAAYFDIGM